jgi:PAS domain S-box-containing protein
MSSLKAISVFLPGLAFFATLAILLFILYNFRRRKQAERGLKESEQRFDLLVEHIKDYAIFMIDPKGNVMTWNEGAEQIKGYKAAEVLGKPISIFYSDEDNARGEPEENLRIAAKLGSYECVGVRKRKDGTLFHADVVYTCMRSHRQDIIGYVKITRDISEQRRVEEEMRQSLQKEKELNQMKSRFVTLASHEFNTPLSVILSSTSLLEKYNGDEMGAKRFHHIQRIKNNVKNLRQIMGDFLSLEKLEAGVVSNCPEEVDLVALVGEAIQDMEGSLKAGQAIKLDILGDARIAFLDENLLRNILNNLLSNAVKYSPEQSRIILRLRIEPDAVHFDVADKGIGIPQEEQAHLFERFFRAANTGSIPGTGLGLSIVKKYLDLMGGSITVSSEPLQGTTFSVTLPSVKSMITIS